MEYLTKAILKDDRSKVAQMLQADPGLASRAVHKDSLHEEIAHWIYAGDTALHVAAVVYRVEIFQGASRE